MLQHATCDGVINDFPKSDSLREKAHALIPGGCHVYFKGDDQFPQRSPGFIARGKGCHLWDVDGNEYIEYGMGGRAVTLGHAHPRLVRAARRAMLDGANFSRPAAIEVECAEVFLDLIEGAEMVKFTKDGSTATSGAVKLSRAFTGRDLVAVCKSHPFFSYDDWFIGTTPVDAGIPQAVKDLTRTFFYNDIESVQRLFDENLGQIACLIMEPCKYEHPRDNFLHEVQALCRQHGALFILDEMITGFRMHNGGAQQLYGITPDLSTWGKGLASGFALSALAGRREIMELGGLTHERPRVFLLSTTHGAETHAMAAAIECMKIYQEEPVIDTLCAQGLKLADGLREVIAAHGLEEHIPIIGFPCNLVFGAKDAEGQPSQGYRTLLLQELIKRGVLAPSLVVSYAHTDDDIEQTIAAFDGALEVYRQALTDGYQKHLVGQPSNVVYRKYN